MTWFLNKRRVLKNTPSQRIVAVFNTGFIVYYSPEVLDKGLSSSKISGFGNFFLEEKWITSNFSRSNTILFWYGHSFTFLNTSLIRRTFFVSSVALVVNSLLSTYPQISSLVFLLFSCKILKSGVVNGINNIGETGDPWKTSIWIGSWFLVCPSNFITLDQSVKNEVT